MKLGYKGDGCWIVATVDDMSAPVFEVSYWVLEQIEGVTKVVGLFVEGMEEQSLTFFTALEKRQQRGLMRQKNDQVGGGRILRELKNL